MSEGGLSAQAIEELRPSRSRWGLRDYRYCSRCRRMYPPTMLRCPECGILLRNPRRRGRQRRYIDLEALYPELSND